MDCRAVEMQNLKSFEKYVKIILPNLTGVTIKIWNVEREGIHVYLIYIDGLIMYKDIHKHIIEVLHKIKLIIWTLNFDNNYVLLL